MTQEQMTPVDLVIGQRAVLAPKASIFLGVGNRNARYMTQLQHSFLPLIQGASQVAGTHQKLCEKLYWTELVKCATVSEQKITPIVATHTLATLCRLAYAIKHGGMHSIRLNYTLPKGCVVAVQPTLIEFIQGAMDTLLALYDAFFPAVQDTTPVVLEGEVIPADTVVDAVEVESAEQV